MRILIVEDDDSLAAMLTRGLSEEGFDVARAADGPTGLSMALDGAYDCLLLDVMLPGMDGVSVCRSLRAKQRHLPIIMLTVRNEPADRVAGLKAGADDYVAKPFSFDELLARIQAQLRRSREYAQRPVRIGDLSLDAASLSASRGAVKAELTPKEFTLLSYFLQNPDRIVTERELIEAVWGLAFDPQTNVLNVYLHRLRSKLQLDGRGPVIETIRGKGYRLGGD